MGCGDCSNGCTKTCRTESRGETTSDTVSEHIVVQAMCLDLYNTIQRIGIISERMSPTDCVLEVIRDQVYLAEQKYSNFVNGVIANKADSHNLLASDDDNPL